MYQAVGRAQIKLTPARPAGELPIWELWNTELNEESYRETKQESFLLAVKTDRAVAQS